jgi:hypothetical protein
MNDHEFADEIRRIGDNLVAEFRKLADEEEARIQALEDSRTDTIRRVASAEKRLRTLESEVPPSV